MLTETYATPIEPNDTRLVHAGTHLPTDANPDSRWVRASELPNLFCSWDIAYRCTQSGWLKPVLRGKRRTIYRLTDVLQCMRRIEDGELPPPRAKLRAS
jgi:hypothetical protein